MWRELRLGLAGPLSPARRAQPVGLRNGFSLMQAEWRAEVAGWAQHFATLAGADVALHFDDSLHAAAALFGAWHAGKTVWWPGDALPETAARLQQQVQAFAGDWPTRADACARVAPAAEPELGRNWQALDAQAPQLVVFTSGSSGEPLAIRKRLAQLFDEVHALEAEFGARLGSASVCGTVSHQHIYGLLFRLLWPLAAGRPIVAQRVAYLEDLGGASTPLVLIASPAHLKRLGPQPALARQLLAVFSSGGPLPAEALAPCAQQLGQTPIEVYGSSETGGVAWRQRAPGAGEDAAWRALPGVDWRLDGERLWLRSPQLGNASDWVEANDLARAEGPGFVLLGRADRIVKIEEKRVSLAAIEQALMASGEISALRLVLLAGRRQELGVVLVPRHWDAVEREGRSAWLAPLRARLEPLLDATVRPRRWRLVSELPQNAQGKSTQAALQALFDPLRPPARLLQREARSALWQLELPASLPVFDGHFDDHPVLPGVVQLEWAERFARELFAELQPAFAGLEQLKFQQVVPPGVLLQLQLDIDAAGSELRFAFRSERGAHSSGRLRFSPLMKLTALIPVYNHGRPVAAVVARLRAQGLPVLLVDDGSDAATAQALQQLAAADPAVRLLRLNENQGKGGAMLAGFAAAAEAGFSHALQIDADGQHNADDAQHFVAAAQAQPEGLICGCPVYDDTVPRGRLYGRYATHIWVWINTLSFALRDSMCGFRLYPLAPTLRLMAEEHLGRRMDFDTEIAVRLIWRGVPVVNLPTRVHYPKDGLSHFRLWEDNVRITAMHTRLFFGMVWRLPRLLARKFA